MMLAVSAVIGYAAQRSGYCTVSGVRDVVLFGDTYLVNSILGLFAGALISFTILSRTGYQFPEFPLLWQSPGLTSTVTLFLTVIGGLGVGFFSILSDGCPIRQHVRAAMGRKPALSYLGGFYLGILYYFVIVSSILAILYGSAG
jgi:uncharacterized membrane protein YedE/YeeE